MEEFSPKRLNHLQKQLLILCKISTTSSDVGFCTKYWRWRYRSSVITILSALFFRLLLLLYILFLIFQFLKRHIICPFPLVIFPIICDRSMSSILSSTPRWSLQTLRTNPSVPCILSEFMGTRQYLVQKLNQARKSRLINSFWTRDGRIFAKKTESSSKTIINIEQDIEDYINDKKIIML
jgi:hypothetical protein